MRLSWADRPSVLRLLAAVAVPVAALVAMLLTSSQMAELRVASPSLSQAMSWLEVLDLPFDMDHVTFFAMLAVALRLVLPKARWWWLLLCFAVLACSTELLQFFTVGRTPKLLDARDDLVGACLGLLVGALPLWLGRCLRGWFVRRRPPEASS